MFLYEYELAKASDILTRELFKLKPGETFVITADTESNLRVVNATAAAAHSVGAKPMVILLASPLGVSEAADPMLPVESLTAALSEADAWVEFNNQWLLYSTPYNRAMKASKKLRYLNLVGMNEEMMVRLIGRVDYPVLGEFLQKVYDMTVKAKRFKFTTPAGTDLEFEGDPERRISLSKGYADQPGSHFLAGQISFAPKFDTINGTLVFDGSVDPPLRKLEQPIVMTIEEGVIVKVEGGNEAREYEMWLDSWNHPQMRRLAHASWSFHPNAKLTGNIVEDERVWGATEWGIGAVGPIFSFQEEPIPAPSHSDGICMNTSAWIDGVQLLDNGKVVHEELRELAKKLGKE
ncbi:MAG: aminopeptidase [Bacillota bacterium]|nr:aminopeptidase [Bacillota bacterium]HOB89341.1 aminopeptidase [Bacillota bacterium]HOJ58528.1 aminopeptidase [Bacillota bacterium]HOL02839.1 aminopeptidase [Bacillota bacterium]HPO81179.1 aminopeptidase [Bacillota bacterium]